MMGRGFLDGMLNAFIVRIGTFFVLIGVGVFILFIASDAAGQTNFDYLFWSVLSVTVGIMLRRRRPPPPPSGRFGYVRKMREGSKKHREK
jgi:hypothetical protein